MTAQVLKAYLETPVALFILMMLASLMSALQQIRVARESGSPITFWQYLRHIPETLATVIGNVIGFALLILTDQLNYAAVLGIGFGVNNLSDLIRSGGRSATLQSK